MKNVINCSCCLFSLLHIVCLQSTRNTFASVLQCTSVFSCHYYLLIKLKVINAESVVPYCILSFRICQRESTVHSMPVEVHKVATVVAAYWTTSISMVFANKYLVGGRNTEDISLFVSWFQCIMTVMLVVGFKVMRGWRNEKSESWLTVAQLRTTMLATPVLAMSGFFVGMLSFNNMCLKLVGVSFYQVRVNEGHLGQTALLLQ